MFLPKDIILCLYDYLNFSDIGNFMCICKNMPELDINYTTYVRNTIYTGKENIKITSKSYLLTNIKGCYKPGLIKNNFLEIKISRGTIIYHFNLYKSIYNSELSIIYYLKNTKWKTVTIMDENREKYDKYIFKKSSS